MRRPERDAPETWGIGRDSPPPPRWPSVTLPWLVVGLGLVLVGLPYACAVW